MPRLFDTGIFSVNDSDGSVGAGWKLNFYTTGTSNRKATYPTRANADAGTSANANPVVADANGRFAPIWLTTGDYKAVLTDDADVVIATKDPADWNPKASDITLASGASIETTIGGLRTDVRTFGVTLDGSTNDTAAWQTAVDSGDPLWVPAGTSLIYDSILVPAGCDIMGVGARLCRLEKRFFETGDNAMIMPSSLTGGADNVTIRGIGIGCQSGVYTSGGVRSGKLIQTGDSENWLLEDIYVNHWNDWAIAVGGRGHLIQNVMFQNPASVLGCDGLHIWGCDDPSKPIKVRNVGGTTYDDIVGLFPIESGSLSNWNITGVDIDGVWGTSTGARVLGIGLHRAALTGTIANVRARNLFGKGTIVDNGAVYIYYNPSVVGGVIKDIEVEGVIDGTDCQSILDIRGPAADAATLMTDIRAKIRSMDGVTGPSGANTYGVRLLNHIDKLQLDLDIEVVSAEHGIHWTSPYDSRAPKFRGHIQGGTGNVVNLPTATAAQSIIGLDLDMEITNVADGARGISLTRVTDGRIRAKVQRVSGGTTTIGIYEAADCSNNYIANGDYSLTDTPVGLAQTDSIWRNNKGYVTEARGTADILNGATTVVVTHGLGYTPNIADITLTSTESLAAGTHLFVNNITSTQFIINLSAAASADRTIGWKVARSKE